MPTVPILPTPKNRKNEKTKIPTSFKLSNLNASRFVKLTIKSNITFIIYYD